MLLEERTVAPAGGRGAFIPWMNRIPRDAWAVVGLTILGGVLRFATISKQSFWLDEALAVRELHHSFGAMYTIVGAREANPPLYFVLGWLWSKAFGLTEPGLRSLSAVSGTVLIPIAYLCGRELISRRGAVLTAALVAVSPFMIWYSQEAREYMLLATFAACALLFFARAWRRPAGRDVVWWGLFAALALLTNYFAIFSIAPEAVLLLIRRRGLVTFVAIGAVTAVGLGLLPHLLDNVGLPTGWIGSLPLSLRLKQLPTTFAIGNLYQSSAVSYGLIGAAILAGAVTALVLIGASTTELRGAGLAALVGGVTVLAPVMLAVVGHDYLVPRALIAAWVPLAIVLGAACTGRAPARIPGLALGIVCIAAFIYSWARIEGDAQFQKPNWRGVAHALGPARAVRAVVAYDGNYSAVPIALYLNGASTVTGDARQFEVGELDIVGSPWQATPTRLPGGARLVESRRVGDTLIRRFQLARPSRFNAAQIRALAGQLLTPSPADTAVIVQRPSGAKT